MNVRTRWISAFIVLVAALLSAPVAQACMTTECPWWDPSCWWNAPVDVEFLSDERVIVRIRNYVTTELVPGEECVTAMPNLGGVTEARKVMNFDSRTDFPLEEVSFSPSDIPGVAIAAMAKRLGFDSGNDLPWNSFVSTTTSPLPDGNPNHFVWELQLEPGTDPLEFVEELRTHGALLTASSDANGIPNGGHTEVKPFSKFSIEVTLPPNDN